MPTRRPPSGRIQILKSPADILVMDQPSDAHGVGGPLVLPDDVERVRVPAQVRDVHVAVMSDHLTVADRAEQAAEGEEGVESAGLAEVVQHLLERVQDVTRSGTGRCGRTCARGGRPCPRRPACPSSSTTRIGSVPVPKPTRSVEHRLAAHVQDEAHVGDPVQVGRENPRPADPAAVEPRALALGVERPDPLAAELDVDDLVQAARDADPAVGHRDAAAHEAPLQRRNCATMRATCGSSDL